MTDLGHGRGWLADAAAASIERIDQELGHPLQTTEAGRTWAQQKAHWDTYQRYGKPIALHPDAPSIHQLGNAIDSDEAQRIVGIMHDHGWRQTVYRGGELVEPWHFEYDPSTDNHYGEESDMALNADTDYPAFAAMLQRALRYDVRPDGVGATWTLGPTVWERLGQIQAAQSGVKIDAAAVAKAVIEAIPDDIAQDVLDGLAERLGSA